MNVNQDTKNLDFGATNMNKPIRVLHIITTLEIGGAETNLYHLLKEMNSTEFNHQVICLDGQGIIGDWIANLGIPVFSLGMRKIVPRFTALFRAYRYLKKFNPDMIHTHMYHANLLGLMLSWKKPCIWGIYCSNLDNRQYSLRSRWIQKLNFFLSRWPKQIIFNSESGLHYHIKYGFPARRSAMIPSGFNTDIFKPDSQMGEQIRQKNHIPTNAPVIGYFARLDVMKNHEALLKTIPLVLQKKPQTHFILAGRGIEKNNPLLKQWLSNIAELDQIHLLGERQDIHELYNALDLFVMTSRWGEGLPSVIGEAMSSGIPCLVTDVGDNRRLVGDTGMFISSEKPETIAQEIIQMLETTQSDRETMSLKARERILAYFQISYIAQQYTRLYQDIIQEYVQSPADHS